MGASTSEFARDHTWGFAIPIFAWGAIGAAAPEVIRLYHAARSGTPEELRRLSYWLCTLAYVALGGGFAALVAKSDGYAGFVAGASTEYAVLGAWFATSSKGREQRHTAPAGLEEVEEFTSTPSTGISRTMERLRRHAFYLAANG